MEDHTTNGGYLSSRWEQTKDRFIGYAMVAYNERKKYRARGRRTEKLSQNAVWVDAVTQALHELSVIYGATGESFVENLQEARYYYGGTCKEFATNLQVTLSQADRELLRKVANPDDASA